MEKQFNDFAYQVFASRMFAIPDARLGWDAGVQAERERIKDLLRQSSDWFEDDQMKQANWLLEKIDDT